MSIDVKIVNVVASVTTFMDIPLDKLAATLPNTEYNPEQFPALVLRLKPLKVTALVFSTGKLVCTGAKSEKILKEGVKEILAEFKKIGLSTNKKPEIKIQNMVASGNLHMNFNLNTLAFKLDNAEYEPERFPGLVYKVPNSHTSFLIFGTGKIVVTGARSVEEVETSVKELTIKLKKIVKSK